MEDELIKPHSLRKQAAPVLHGHPTCSDLFIFLHLCVGPKPNTPIKNSKPLVSCKVQQSCSLMGLNDSKHVAGVGWWLLYHILPSRQQVQIGVAKKPVQTHGRAFLKNPATVWPFSTSRFYSSPMMNRWQQVPQCAGLFPRCGRGQQLLLILGEWCHQCLKKKNNLHHDGSWHVDWRLIWQMLVKLNVCLTKSRWISKAKAGWAHRSSGRHCCSYLPFCYEKLRKKTMCVSYCFEGAETCFQGSWHHFVSLTRRICLPLVS